MYNYTLITKMPTMAMPQTTMPITTMPITTQRPILYTGYFYRGNNDDQKYITGSIIMNIKSLTPEDNYYISTVNSGSFKFNIPGNYTITMLFSLYTGIGNTNYPITIMFLENNLQTISKNTNITTKIDGTGRYLDKKTVYHQANENKFTINNGTKYNGNSYPNICQITIDITINDITPKYNFMLSADYTYPNSDVVLPGNTLLQGPIDTTIDEYIYSDQNPIFTIKYNGP